MLKIIVYWDGQVITACVYERCQIMFILLKHATDWYFYILWIPLSFLITDNVYNELLTVHTESQTHKTAAIIQQLKLSGIPSGKESQSYLDDCAQLQLRCGRTMNLFRRCSLRKSIYHLKHQHSVWSGAPHSYKITYPEDLKANAVSAIKC